MVETAEHGSFFPRSRITLALLIALVAAPAAAADTIEELLPAQTPLLIRVDGLSQVQDELAGDPLVGFLRRNLPQARQPRAWRQVQMMMGMDSRELIDRYFGRSFAIVGDGAGDGARHMLVSRVDEPDAALVIQRLSLQRVGDLGRFEVFESADGATAFAFNDRWMVIAEARAKPLARRVLSIADDAPRLATAQHYVNAVARLPAQPHVLLYARDARSGELHAGAVKMAGRDIEMAYHGRSEELRKGLADLRPVAELASPPLPVGTIASAMVGLPVASAIEPKARQFADAVLAPRQLTRDTLPGLEAPLTAFLGSVTPAGEEADQALRTPVLGLAVKVGDERAAEDLQRMLSFSMQLVNLELARQGVEPLAAIARDHEGQAYQVIDVGPVIVRQLAHAAYVSAAQITYGRVGDWFILCTHEQFYRQCLDVAAGRVEGIQSVDESMELPLRVTDQPLAAGWVRGPALAGLLRSLLNHIEQLNPALAESAREGAAGDERVRLLKALRVVAGAADYYRAVKVEAHRLGEDRASIRLQLVRDGAADGD